MILDLETCSACCNAAVDRIDGGGGPGKLKIKDADGNVLCEFTLANPAFGDAVDGVAEANLPLSATGTASAGSGAAPSGYDVTDSNDALVWSGDIPGNMTIDKATIAHDQPVSVTSWAHSQPAS